jgi:hypothetical protein
MCICMTFRAWFFDPSFDRRYLDIYPTFLRILLGIEAGLRH